VKITHAILFTFTLGLFLFPSIAIGSQESSAEQKKQWEEDAAKFKRMAAALSGKMGGFEDNTQNEKIILDQPKTDTDQKAKL
jgi:hypothetical protein